MNIYTDDRDLTKRRLQWGWVTLVVGVYLISNMVKDHMGSNFRCKTFKKELSLSLLLIVGSRLQPLKHVPLISTKIGALPNNAPIND